MSMLRSLVILVGSSLVACSDTGDDTTPVDARACVVDVPAGVITIAAGDAGLVVGVGDGEHAQVIHRMHGTACALQPDDTAIAAVALLDVDDAGDVYLFPAESTHPGVTSSMQPEFFGGLDGTVARVDDDLSISEVVTAGRGIWSFGVAPAGDAVWMTACGPTGIFALDDAFEPTMTPPTTSWQQEPSVLTDRDTFWSLDVAYCEADACPVDLVRTTAAGSTTVGSALLDLGGVAQPAELVRCGAHVCGLVDRGVVRWDDDGNVDWTIDADTLGLALDATVLDAAGSSAGIYVLTGDRLGTRVVFVPDPHA